MHGSNKTFLLENEKTESQVGYVKASVLLGFLPVYFKLTHICSVYKSKKVDSHIQVKIQNCSNASKHSCSSQWKWFRLSRCLPHPKPIKGDSLQSMTTGISLCNVLVFNSIDVSWGTNVSYEEF